MILTAKDFVFDCRCGREHSVSVKKIRIEPRALGRLRDDMDECGIGGRITAVYDENTKAAAAGYDFGFDEEFVFSPASLHADETAVDRLMKKLNGTDVLAAIGSGTIHDIVRWCANELNIPFVSCPTAASVDGFCSSVSAMTWHGFKKTFPGTAPALVAADTAVIAAAPMRLTRSGIGDMLGKAVSLAEWKLGRLLTGEYYCEKIADMTREALLEVRAAAGGFAKRDFAAYEKLIYGLLLSGISMQLAGNSRPASGAEHHISHFIEMGVVGENSALHGEKVGVGAVMASSVYHRLAEMGREDAAKLIRDTEIFDTDVIKCVFGDLAESILEENSGSCTGKLRGNTVVENWDGIRAIVGEIPAAEELRELLLSVGAKTALSDIGISGTGEKKILKFAPAVRNRLTLLRVAVNFGLL